MFGIGTGEIVLIVMVILMLFGADKIPEVVRTLARFINQVKNATNEIKTEIKKSADDVGITRQINEIKDTFEVEIHNQSEELNKFKEKLEEPKQEIENINGPIKRQR